MVRRRDTILGVACGLVLGVAWARVASVGAQCASGPSASRAGGRLHHEDVRALSSGEMSVLLGASGGTASGLIYDGEFSEAPEGGRLRPSQQMLRTIARRRATGTSYAPT